MTLIRVDLTNRARTRAAQPSQLPFVSSKQEHCKIVDFLIYILRPHPTKPTEGSQAIYKDGLVCKGLVSWPEPDLEFSEDSDSDLEPPPYSSFATTISHSGPPLYVPFQTNPAILTHVQKSLEPNNPLILTIDVYPDFEKYPVTLPEEHLKEENDFEDPWDYFEEAKDAFSEDSRTKAKLLQERRLAIERNRVIDTTIYQIVRLIAKSEVTIAKAVPSPNNPKTNAKDLKMIDIQELEKELARIMKARPELGVKFHWGLQNPVHSFRGPERVFTKYVFREMIPRTRVEMLRKKNLDRWSCECGRLGCRFYG